MISGTTLLRTLTLKSLICFGEFKNLSVQELIQLDKHSYLLNIYYNCSKINFDATVKSMLKITPEREIKKPGKNKKVYKENSYKIIGEIIEDSKKIKEQLQTQTEKESFIFKHKALRNFNVKSRSRNIGFTESYLTNKLNNRSRNQNSTKW